MVRFYANENFPLPVVEELRRLGHNIITVQEVGKANQKGSNAEVLAFASADNRAILTINRKHFMRLHRISSDHQGIIICTADLDFTGQAYRIHEAIQTHDSLEGKLIRVNRPTG
jgi:predicted nuclease of predicted toxin-antitoxin system